MIDAGFNLCRKCGKLSNTHEPFYRDNIANLSAWMKWSEKQNEYILESPNSSTSLHLLEADQYTRGQFPPDTITAEQDDPSAGIARNVVSMSRCCPECKEVNIFDSSVGKLPAFVALLIGPKGSGKSSWLGAVSHALGALNTADYPYKIEFHAAHDTLEQIKSTIGDDIGNTTFLHIVEKESNKHVAMLYLLDYSGESFEHRIDPQSPLGRILYCTQANIPDCAIFVEPAVERNLTSKGVCERITELRDFLSQIPVAMICSCADELIVLEGNRVNAAKNRRLHATEERGMEAELPYIPQLTANTFPRTVHSEVTYKQLAEDYYAPVDIVQRIRFQDYIASRACEQRPILQQLQTVLPENSDLFYRFMVQSCKPMTDSEGTEQNDYTRQFNTVDPLIWLLHKLKLFPLTLRGE